MVVEQQQGLNTTKTADFTATALVACNLMKQPCSVGTKPASV